MKQLRFILIPLVLAYLSIVGAYVLFQRHMIYHPVGLTGTTPADFHLKDFKEVSFISFDGIHLKGWWIKHPETDSHRPVLLYCHGNADCVSQLAEVSKIFYDFGFDELIFDYRSYGGSEKAPLSEMAVDGDALAAYWWLKSRGIPEHRIIIWGHSLGSSVAAQLSTRTHPAGLILEGAFPSIHDVSRQRNPWLLVPDFLIWDKFETEKYVQDRGQLIVEKESHPPECPLLMIHAEKDTIIPIELGREVFQEATEPKQWLEIKGINHNDFPSVAYQYQKPIQEFVDRCLKQ